MKYSFPCSLVSGGTWGVVQRNLRKLANSICYMQIIVIETKSSQVCSGCRMYTVDGSDRLHRKQRISSSFATALSSAILF